MANRLRGLVLVSGLVCALFAWHFWTAGTPPLWSFAAPRAETVVTRAYLTDAVSAAGREHQVATIAVVWPPGSDTEAVLPGLWSVNQRRRLHVAGELVRAHRVGSEITVRVVDGLPVADRLDLHELAWALLTTMFALGLTLGGLTMLIGRLRRRDGDKEERVT